MRAFILIASLLLGASTLLPMRARACSCVAPGPFGVVLPQEGDRVPSNARIWVADLEGTELLAPDGSILAVDASLVELVVGAYGESRLQVLTPREQLPPGQGYSVRNGRSGPILVTFDVEDTIDDEAPPAPEVLGIDADVNEDIGNTCGKYRGVGSRVQAEGLTFAQLASDDDLAAEPPAGHALEAQHDANGIAYFAYGIACSPQWPGEEITRMRFTSFDIAGNRSDSSREISIDRPDYGASACSVSDLSPKREPFGASALLLLAAMLAWRRAR